MTQSNQIRREEIVIPNRIAVFEDKKTKVKSVAFPFVFPDGITGVVTVTRLSKVPWNPVEHLQSVHINFK